jgi:ethanolamine utilization protein EutN
MLIGRVIGRVVATIKAEGLEGVKLLLVEPLDDDGNPKGPAIVAADATRMAGEDDLVHYEGGREAALALDPWYVPVDHTIMGLIDSLAKNS